MRLCVSRALVERSTCPYVYRWVDVFAHPAPVYAPVDGYVGVYVYASVNVYVAVAVHIYMYRYLLVHPSIHPFIYAPEQKIEIENRDHPQIQNSIFKIGNPKSDFRFAFEIKIKIPKLFFKNLLPKSNLYGIIYMCLSGTIHFVKEIHYIESQKPNS